jgi:cell wall-associated NlpC family hydrolase
MVLTETSPGVTSIDFDIDEGKAADTVTVNCRTSRWVAAPGAVVLLSDLGPADGRWLVSDLRRGIYDANATITLTRAQKPLPEPAADTTTTTTSADGTTTTAGDTASIAAAAASGDPLARLYQCMQNLTARRFPYVWAGGHASAGTPTGGGFDCSGSVGAVLACAGLGFQLGQPVPDSGTMAATWGEAGPGQRLTMYANPDHVFLVLDGHHFGTGDWGKGWNGPGLNPNMHFTNGFTPRHWPGL